MFRKIKFQGIRNRSNGLTPLHQASFANKPNIIEYLIEKNVDLNEQDLEGMTALDYACTLETINLLTKHGAIHGSPDKALFNAVNCSNKETFDYLLDNNLANIDDKDDTGQTVLHMAIICGYENIEDIFSRGANINANDNFGNTPLIFATRYNYDMTDIVRSLLNLRPDLEAKDLNGMTALHWAASQGKLEVVELLVEKNANTEAIDNNGKTPLDLAREEFHHSVVDYLTKARQSG